MLEITNCSVYNFDNALRGARNPLNSWDRSDSYFDEENHFVFGENDLTLLSKLCRAGSDHRKFMRQIFVSVDVKAPLYWWKEFDTYKVGTTANSTSTMHKIHSAPFSVDDFSADRLDEDSLTFLGGIIEYLEKERLLFNETKDKRHWWNMIQLLPTSYQQLRTCTMSYECLTSMYFSRRSHKLDEWHVFCDMIETLPYAEGLILECGKK